MLKVRQASYQVAGKTILQHLDIDAKPGDILGVLGPNGAGKTTLLKMLSGQIESKRMVYWREKPIEEYSATDRAKQIAVVNQFNRSVFALNLEQIVSMGLLPHQSLLSSITERDKRQITTAIENVGLLPKRLQAFHTLSGGEQQRGLIARALVQKAQLLVLDEPVNHLDVFYQHQILQLLKHLAITHNLCVVMSLHDLNLASMYCGQLCLLDNGAINGFGPPEQVLNQSRIESVFSTACEVSTDQRSHKLRVDFYPDTLHDASQETRL